MSDHIVVAMSGGVDSSVAAYLLKEEGHEVIGVSMQVWDYRNHGGCSSRATCCAPDDFTDARMVADKIGVPYYVFDFEESFREKVIDTFLGMYQRGETPNPCIDCNNKVKFAELRTRAEALGYSQVATGHYARIERNDDGYHLLRGVDKKKDQSYFLYGMSQAELAQTQFPVGEMNKDDVREIARRAGLLTAEKPESQDICFISGTVKEFLERHGAGRPGGNFLSVDGRVLGRHEGIHSFTVGQRKGLGLGGFEEPLYVIGIDAETESVVVGTRADLERESFFVDDVSWLSPTILSRQAQESSFEFDAIAQLRHQHAGCQVRLTVCSDTSVEVQFKGDWTSVAPGQAAVFYDLENSEVLGGGRIRPVALSGILDGSQMIQIGKGARL